MSTLPPTDTQHPSGSNNDQIKPPAANNKPSGETNPNVQSERLEPAVNQANQPAASQSQSNNTSKEQPKPAEPAVQQMNQTADTKQPSNLQKDNQNKEDKNKTVVDNKDVKPVQSKEVVDKKEARPEEKKEVKPDEKKEAKLEEKKEAKPEEKKEVKQDEKTQAKPEEKKEIKLDEKKETKLEEKKEVKLEEKKEVKPDEKNQQVAKDSTSGSQETANKVAINSSVGQNQGKQQTSHNAETKIALRANDTKKTVPTQDQKKTDQQRSQNESKKLTTTTEQKKDETVQSPAKERVKTKSIVASQQTPDKSKSQSKDQDKPAESLTEAISSIFSFFSVTKTNVEKTSDRAITRLGEIITKSKLVSKIQNNEYQPIITSDVSDLNEKIAKNKSKSPSKADKSKTGLSTKKSTFSGQKSKFQPPALRTKGEVEEQIRHHKMEEIKKWKRMLEDKLESLDEQLVEIVKVDEAAREASPEVVKAKKVYKETKEEALERQQKALEFAKKMSHAQKDLENRREKRREVQESQVNKQIDVLYQQHLDNVETQKSPVAINRNKSAKIGAISKSHNAFAILEERKQELRQKREFDKQPSNGDEAGSPQDLPKQSTKRLYRSPVLDKVLEYDEEQKQIELRKVTVRKALHDKQVEYGKEVKKEYLPKITTGNKLEFHGRLRPGVYRSHNLEAYLKRVGGKDFLYGYIDKMKSKYGGEEGVRASVDPQGSKLAKDGLERGSNHSKKFDDERDEQNYTPAGYDLDQDNYMLTETANDEDSQKVESYRDRDRDRDEGRSRTLQPGKGKTKKSKHYEEATMDDSGYTNAEAKYSKRQHDKRKSSVGQAQSSYRKHSEDWKQDVEEDHMVLKDKISSMLNDIKSMEAQVKSKEERLLKDFESKNANRA